MEILHKAKRLDNGEWIFGGSIIQFLDNGERTVYMPQFKEKCICTHDAENDNILSFDKCVFYKVDPETVCVYTGMKDKDGRRIWENDIIVAWSEGKKAIGIVKKRIDGLYIIYPSYQMKEFWGLCPNNSGKTTVKIVGNKFDNPEMLEVE